MNFDNVNDEKMKKILDTAIYELRNGKTKQQVVESLINNKLTILNALAVVESAGEYLEDQTSQNSSPGWGLIILGIIAIIISIIVSTSSETFLWWTLILGFYWIIKGFAQNNDQPTTQAYANQKEFSFDIVCPYCQSIVTLPNTDPQLYSCSNCQKSLVSYFSNTNSFNIFKTLFMLLGIVAKADGIVTKSEINAVTSYMDDFLELSKEKKDIAIFFFNKGKNSTDQLDFLCNEFYDYNSENQSIIFSVFEIMVQVAYADGFLDQKEENLLNSVKKLFSIPSSEFERLKNVYGKAKNKSYSILGCKPDDSIDTIKNKYRTLVKEYHPDKIIAKGLPDDFVKFAQNRFNEIQKAYEDISAQKC